MFLFTIQPAYFASYAQNKNGLYSPTFDASSKTGAPLKQNGIMNNSNNSFPVNSVALQGVPLTAAGGLMISGNRPSPLDVQAAAQLAASQLFGAGSPEEKRKNKNYKTELCRPYEEAGYCKYGDKCQFAHGSQELQNVPRHPKFKTEPCKNFHQTGYCPYGKRCHFVHGSVPEEIQSAAGPNSARRSPPSSAPFSSMAPQVLSIQPSYTSSLGSAGESPVPSSAGSESPAGSFSPGLASYSPDVFQMSSTSMEDQLFQSPGLPPPMTFPLPNGAADPKNLRFVFPSPATTTKFGSSTTCADVDGLAAGLEGMFVPGDPLGALQQRGNRSTSRLNVFRRLTSSSC